MLQLNDRGMAGRRSFRLKATRITDASKPFFVQALDALKAGDRRRAANLLARELRKSNSALKNLPSVARPAEHIGVVDLAIEASRRPVVPGSIES